MIENETDVKTGDLELPTVSENFTVGALSVGDGAVGTHVPYVQAGSRAHPRLDLIKSFRDRFTGVAAITLSILAVVS